MIRHGEIQTERAGASHDVETNLKDWMENHFVTKEEFQKEFGGFRAEMLKWMFIFWSSQLVAIGGMLFGFVKLLRP